MVDPSQRLIVCNSRFQHLFALAPDVVQPGTSIRDLFESTSSDSDFALGMVSAEQQVLIREQRAGTYFRGLPDGRTFAVSHQPMADGGWVATYEDISERRRAEARIAHMAHHDALTDLPNRVLFRERMEAAFARLARYQEPVTVHCIDLDRFKAVNDTLGHPIGDALLKTVAERLLSCVRSTDLVARLGGDEFAILQLASEEALDAEVLARRVLDVLSAPYELDGQQVVIGASIGVAIAPQDGDTPDQLLKNADLALYRAKADGRGTYRFFEAAMDAELQARRVVELDLRKALAAGEFEPYYQPLVSLETGEVTGCEALLRWHHPERGLVPPAEFIPIAEEIGLIGAIGDWVLREACNEAARWPKPIKVAVNLSAMQLKNRQLAQTVVLALANSGLPANRLELEITEFGVPAGQRDDARDPARDPQPRGAHRDGRLRHRLFVAQLSALVPVRQDQDRPQLRARPRDPRRLQGDRAFGRDARPAARHGDDRRGHRNRRAARAVAPDRLHRGPGLLLRPPGAGARIRQMPGEGLVVRQGA